MWAENNSITLNTPGTNRALTESVDEVCAEGQQFLGVEGVVDPFHVNEDSVVEHGEHGFGGAGVQPRVCLPTQH